MHFVLDPLYKIYGQTLGEHPKILARVTRQLGLQLKPAQLHQDPKPLLRTVCTEFFGNASAFVDALVPNVPSPAEAAPTKVELTYTGVGDGDDSSPLTDAMRRCDAGGPLMINVVKLYSTPETLQ